MTRFLGMAFLCLVIVLISGLLLIPTSKAQGTDSGLANSPWPMFHHDPQHTGRSAYSGPASPQLKWSYTTGSYVNSSPAIASDGTIYFGSDDGNLYAINPDGSLRWSYTTGNKVSSSPAISDDGTIYVGSQDNNIYAITPNGSLKWKYTTGNWIYSSPVIGPDGTIYVGSEDGSLYAIYPSGSLRWKYGTGGPVGSSPAIGTDGTLYFGSDDKSLYAIDAVGYLKWKYTIGCPASSPSIGTDGTIYFGGTCDNTLYALNPNGSLKWHYSAGYSISSTPAIGEDGTVYFGSWDNNLYAIDAGGTLKWRYITGNAILGSPTIGADRTIYVGAYDGKLYAINPDGSLKWNCITGGIIAYSSPAIGADGSIYIGADNGKLCALGVAPWTGCHLTVAVGTYVEDAQTRAFSPDYSFSPGECFYVNAVVVNNGSDTALEPIKATIVLPSGVELADTETYTKTWPNGNLAEASPEGLLADFWWRVCCSAANGWNTIEVDAQAATPCDQTFPVRGYVSVHQKTPGGLEVLITQPEPGEDCVGGLPVKQATGDCGAQNFTVKATITNKGDSQVNLVYAIVSANPTPGWVQLPTPAIAGPFNLGPGGSQNVQFNMVCVGTGLGNVTVTASGTDAGTGVQVTADDFVTIDQKSENVCIDQVYKAHLIGDGFFFIQDYYGKMLYQEAVVPGTYFHVVIPVMNTGDADAQNVQVYFTLSDAPEAPCTKSFEYVSYSGDATSVVAQGGGAYIASFDVVPGHSTRKAVLLLHYLCEGHVSVWVPDAVAAWGAKGIRGFDANTGEAIPQDNIVAPPCPREMEQIPFKVAAIATDNATNISQTSAMLNGHLTNLGSASSVSLSFKYGADTTYGNTSATETRTTTGSFSTKVAGLLPGTTYHFRAVSASSDEATSGGDMTFTTSGPPFAQVTSALDDAASAVSQEKSKGFNVSAAENLLTQAQQAFQGETYQTALDLASKAKSLALDIDQDGVPNEQDFAPTIKNIYIYAGASAFAFVLIVSTSSILTLRWRRKRAEEERIEEQRRIEEERKRVETERIEKQKAEIIGMIEEALNGKREDKA